MKKLLLSLFCAVGLMTANAETLTENFSKGLGFPESSSAASATEATVTSPETGITYTYMGCYTNTGYIMLNAKNFAGAYLSFSLPYDCSTIVFTIPKGASANAANAIDVYAGSTLIAEKFSIKGDSNNPMTYTLEIPSASQAKGTVYKLVTTTTAYNSQIASLEYVDANSNVAAPKISCENNLVTITCETANATIYYSLDGSTPSNTSATSYKYTAPVSITETVTVKAIAYVGNEASGVASYTANYVGSYPGFEDLMAKGSGAEGTVAGPITTVYQNGSYLYVVDAKSYPMLVYGNVGASYTNGDVLSYVSGKYSPYNNLPELTNPVLGEVSKGTPVEPAEIALEELSNDMVNAYVLIKNVTIGENNSITDGTGESVLYNRFTGVTIPTDGNYDITGFVSIYGTTIQIYPVEFAEASNGVETVATPVFNPAGGAVTAGQQITITCATEGASIFFTVDGTEPNIASNSYTAPITLEQSATIKAIAVKEEMNDSKVATATFTIFDANATEATFDFTDTAWLESIGVTLPTDASTGTDIAGENFTVNAVNLSFPENAASNKARIWRLTANSGGGVQLRVFAGDDFTVSIPDGYYLKGIIFDCDETYQNFAPAAENGTLTDEGVWTPADDAVTTSVTFVPSKASRINAITVYYGATVVATPVFSLEAGAVAAGTALELTCATPDAKIYYTTDGTQPNTESTLYTEPITINEITAVYAYAVREGFQSSSVTSALYTIEDEEATVVDFLFNDEDFLVSFLGTTPDNDLFTNTTDGKFPVQNKFYTYEDFTVVFSAKNGATANPRFYNNGTTIDFRMYIGQWFSLAYANPDFYISQIYFTKRSGDPFYIAAGNSDQTSYTEANLGTFVQSRQQGVWVPSENEKLNALRFFNISSSDDDKITTRICTMSVSLKSKPDAVSDITATGSDAAPEYYNLQGIRVANPAAGNLYIVRQGETISKVLVK